MRRDHQGHSLGNTNLERVSELRGLARVRERMGGGNGRDPGGSGEWALGTKKGGHFKVKRVMSYVNCRRKFL